MSLFEVKPVDQKVYSEELQDFLPQKMIDVHCHVWRSSDIAPKKPNPKEVRRAVSWPDLVAKDDPIEDLQETYRLLFPKQQVTPLMFASAAGVSDMKNCNAYIRSCSEKTGYPALYYSRPEQSPDELERLILSGGFLGLKSYLILSPKYIPEKEIRIFDFFPKNQLARMNEMGAIVMLHIPRDGRLRDPVNLAQILEIKHEFPHVRLIIAHIGRAYTREDVGDAFEVLSGCRDLMFDFCANTCEYAMTELLRSVGPNRAMFGTDMPILRMRMRRLEEGGNYVNLVPKGLYGDVSGDRHMREASAAEGRKLTFFAYEEIRSMKRACGTMGYGPDEVERIFHGNAQDLISGARRDIYGI